MQVGFSYIGLIYLLMLFIPNIIWVKNKPIGYENLEKEDRILGILERIGEVGITMIALISKNLNIQGLSPWLAVFIVSAVFMLLYELWWLRYFKSSHRLEDFYSSFLGIPVAGATLPVIAFFLLAIYGKSPHLMLFVIPLGVGHIGIHLNHRKEISKKESEDNNI